MADILTITADNFESEVIQSEQPVLLDFWAEWCGPCWMVAPVVESVADKYAGRLKVGKVNVDEEGELAVRFGIRSIPTLLFFKDGNVAEMVVGFRPEDQFIQVVERVLQQ